MDKQVVAILIPIAFFACIVLCVYFVTRFRSETITKLGGPIPKTPGPKFPWKKVGIVVIGFAVGTLLSGFLFAFKIMIDTSWTGMIVMGLITLSVGIAMKIADNVEDKDQPNIDG